MSSPEADPDSGGPTTTADPAAETSADTGAEVTFADLNIRPEVLRALTDVGYESPSPIQAATIPAILNGSDVVGLAQTGTGKTAAFAVPVLSKIDPTSRNTQCLVLAPTRELALQVAEAFGKYGAHLNVNVLAIYGGSSYTPQLAGLKRGAQVVVGTPGRVIDHLSKGSLDLSHLDYLVLDEADEMLQMGFAEDVERILADTPEYKQVALFSATMPPAIKKITARYLHDPVEVTIKAKAQTAENITQRYIQVAGPRKMDAITRLLEVEPFEAMIVFVRTKQATEEVAEKLRARGFSAAAINGDIPQAVRERTINGLKDGSINLVPEYTGVLAQYFGKSAGKHIVQFVNGFGDHAAVPADGSDRTLARLNQLDESKEGTYAQDIAGDIRAAMQQHAGVFRTQKGMDEGTVKINAIRERVGSVTLKDKSKVWNTARMEALEVDNLIEVAQATMTSAAARKECRGAHTVYDYERPADDAECPLGRNDKEWMKHTLWDSASNSLSYKPVNLKPLTVESVPPKVRTF